LHLIEPLGFELDDKRLRRAGLDYHEFAGVTLHKDWDSFLATAVTGQLYGLSTKGRLDYHRVSYKSGDYLIFGPETRGLPPAVREQLGAKGLLRIPMLAQSRSLNLSNAAALVTLEARRQRGFEGAELAPEAIASEN
jgi:tRNA (cytidine/uridine-2'-O-)-methyltransferase